MTPAQRVDRILVVDDEKDVRTLLRRAFQAKGYEVSVACDGLEAIDSLRAGRPDLMTLDLMMGTMDGWATLDAVRKLPDPPPIVVVSAVPEINITPRIFREGVGAFVAKPFRIDVLIAICRELIALSRGVPMADDRRQAFRRSLAIRAAVQTPEGQPLHEGRVVNLSTLGAQLELPAPLPPGQRIRLSLCVAEGEPAALQCRVQWWRRPDPASSTVCHGLAFTGISAEDQKRLRDIAALD